MAAKIISQTRTKFVHSKQILGPIPALSSTFLSHSASTKPNPDAHTHSNSPTQASLANLLKSHGFPPSKIQSFLGRNPFLLNSSPLDINNSLSVLSSLQIPPKDVVLMVTSCPGVLDFEYLRKWEVSFSKFDDLGISPSVIRSILEYSRRSGVDPDRFRQCLRVLQGVGFKNETVTRVLECFPSVISVEETEIRKIVEVFKGIGIRMDGVDRVFYSYPEVLRFGTDRRLLPLLKEFEGLGFSMELVKREIIRDPQILGMELGELSRCLQLLRTLKCREPIKMKIFGEGKFRAGFEVKLRVDCLCKHGLIRREALKVLWKEPRVIIYGVQDTEKKIEYLVNTMGLSVGCLVDVPEYLGVNFEKQIVPRYNVIAHLYAKGALGDDVGLHDMIKLSRLRFYNLYVKPYPECEKFFGRNSGDSDFKNGYPVGLWKLLKPEKPPASKEEVKNIRSFMEAFA